MARWGGPYPPKAYDADGNEVPWQTRKPAKRVVRWRVDGRGPYERHYRGDAKVAAEAFYARIAQAKERDWPADDRHWPVDPNAPADDEATDDDEPVVPVGPTFAEYAESWYEDRKPGWDSKTRDQRRGALDLAIAWLVYPEDDEEPRGEAGASIALGHLTAEDVRRSLRTRRSVNLRTRAMNERRHAKWVKACDREVKKAQRKGREPEMPPEPVPEPEVVSARTVEVYAITLGMVLKRAQKDGTLPTDVWSAVDVEKPEEEVVDVRMLPSVGEVFKLAKAIAACQDGRGERYRLLVLLGGTTGPRPGELTRMEPDDVVLNDPKADGPYVRYYETEGPVRKKTSKSGTAREVRKQKARKRGVERRVPLMPEVADAARAHLAAGYASEGRLFTSPTGEPFSWGGIEARYWRPACEQVFAGTDRPELAKMPPKTLRKAAITWWLKSHIDVYMAAEWAGNSPDVIWMSYAGAISRSFTEARAMLRAKMPEL